MRKKNGRGSCFLAVALCVGLVTVAGADVLEVAPTTAAVTADDESGITKVVVSFDLSRLRSGEGREIHHALVQWTVAGVPSDEVSEYAAYGVTEAWTAAGVGENGIPDSDADACGRWDIYPRDYERNNGGFVKLDVRDLVEEWAAGERTNYGLVLEMSDLNGASLVNQLGNIRLLLRYGFDQ